MARARLLKPGFFLSVGLSELTPLARLLYAGLWTLADREGRLKDEPKKIKAQLLPYDRCNVDRLLLQLQSRGFLVRYTVNDQAVIEIPTFLNHQHPNIKEPASTLPARERTCQTDANSPFNLSLKPLTEAEALSGEAEPPPHSLSIVATPEPKAAGKTPSRPPPRLKPREIGEILLADEDFITSIEGRFLPLGFSPADLEYQTEKWLDHIETKPPKGNYKNSLRNFLEITAKTQQNGRSPPPEHNAEIASYERRYREGKAKMEAEQKCPAE